MSDLAPLDALFDVSGGEAIALPDRLAHLYGSLCFPAKTGAPPHVISNFVETLDGVTSLAEPGNEAGGPISGNNQHDRMVMGLLRAVCDAVIVGAGTARSVPKHVWSADFIFPDLAGDYHELSRSLGKRERPLNVIVTSSGDIDPTTRVISSGEAPVLIATTEAGARAIARQTMPSSVEVRALAPEGPLPAASILEAARDVSNGDRILVEGGPRLLGDFIAEALLDELFLTIAPQIAGRRENGHRPGLVSGHVFAPEHPQWTSLVSVKRADHHLFLRYAFASEP